MGKLDLGQTGVPRSTQDSLCHKVQLIIDQDRQIKGNKKSQVEKFARSGAVDGLKLLLMMPEIAPNHIIHVDIFSHPSRYWGFVIGG
jgi:hypothetical protein